MEKQLCKDRVLILPQLSARYSMPIPGEQLLMIGGGRQPSSSWLKEAAKSRKIWCIDHGIDTCLSNGLAPDRLIGDGDSSCKENWQKAQQMGITIDRFNPEKDFTDTQLALSLAKEQDAFVVLTGGLGNRWDHTYSTMYSLAYSGIAGCIADELEQVLFLKAGESIQISLKEKPKAISLLPMSYEVEAVTTSGLKWELTDATLSQSMPYAVSNEVLADSFSVKTGKGILAVYICQSE